jgi:uncharacterized membrane protein YphA (DoxX/SURF4 family)
MAHVPPARSALASAGATGVGSPGREEEASLICLARDCAEGAFRAVDVIGILVALYLAIVFLQSGLDKIFDWKGNLDYLGGLFAKSPLAGPVAPLLAVVTVAETAAGVLSALGVIGIVFFQSSWLAAWGALIAAVSLLMVLFGQRMAKAYGDAAVVAPYFLVACLGIWVLGA